jgi:hypothetical protein
MSRNSVGSVTSASQLSQLRYHVLCHVDSLTGGSVRACTGNRFIIAGATTYSPIGGWGGIDDPIAEDSDPFPRSVRLWFSAVNTSSLLTNVVNENMFNRPVKLFRCFLDDSLTVVGTPQLLSSLRVNKVGLKTSDETRGNYFEIECESRLRRNARAQYYDRATLQQVFGSSGDTFFDFMYLIQSTRAQWGELSNFVIPSGIPTYPDYNPSGLPDGGRPGG